MNKRKKSVDSVALASRILGLSEILVEFKPSSSFSHPEINAVFDDKFYIIYFNEAWISQATPEEIMVTALHETRHAYQKANIEFPEFFVGRESKETVKQWKKDFENYVPTKGLENSKKDMEYLTQSIEIDAIAFAHYYMDEFYAVKTIIPQQVKTQVSKRLGDF